MVPPASISSESSSAQNLLSVAVVLILFGLLASTAHLWQLNGPLLLPSGSYALVPAFALILFAWRRLKWRFSSLTLSTLGSSAGLFLVFISDWADRSYNFFPNPSVRGEILLFTLLASLVPVAALPRLLRITLWGSALGLTITFLAESNGRLLFSDDHASFFFRLSMLKAEFPGIPFFYPYWNGGLDARDFFATGALNVFSIFAPLIYLSSLEWSYNLVVAGSLFLLLPTSLYFAARFAEVNPLGRTLASILGLSVGLVWYRWALKYGTMGFITSCSLTPLNLVLALQLLTPGIRISRMQFALFLVSASLMLMWTPSGLAFLPVVCVALGQAAWRLYTKRWPILPRAALLAAALMLLLNLPWLMLFWSVSNVDRFIGQSSPAVHGSEIVPEGSQNAAVAVSLQDNAHRGARGRPGEIDIGKSLQLLRERAFSTNPLLIFFAIPGLFLIERRFRIGMIATALWLLVLGSLLVPLKPQLELDRMLVILSMIACLPAAQSIGTLLGVPAKGLHRFAQCGTLGFILVAPFAMGSILANRTVEQYHFADSLLQNLASAIRDLGGPGRTIFAGCIVHELEEGHLAPLTILSGKELVASAPFHTLWRYTQVIPKSFIGRGDQGIEEYLTLMNVTSVVTHDREWRDYFNSRKDAYRLVWREERFSLFERIGSSSQPFLEGQGELIAQSNDSLTFRLDSPTAVVKYNFFPFLESSSCTLEPYEAAPELRLIKISNCSPGAEVKVKAGSPWRRAFK